jgi:hypothetical protein
MLIGTHTSDGEQNYLQIAQVQMPNDHIDATGKATVDATQEQGGYGNAECKLTVTQKIPHDGEVNRARYMPQNPNMIATRTVMGPVYVFDRTKHASMPKPDALCTPDLVLVGLEREGYGLSWHPGSFEGHVLAASEDHTVCHWSVFLSYLRHY